MNAAHSRLVRSEYTKDLAAAVVVERRLPEGDARLAGGHRDRIGFAVGQPAAEVHHGVQPEDMDDAARVRGHLAAFGVEAHVVLGVARAGDVRARLTAPGDELGIGGGVVGDGGGDVLAVRGGRRGALGSGVLGAVLEGLVSRAPERGQSRSQKRDTSEVLDGMDHTVHVPLRLGNGASLHRTSRFQLAPLQSTLRRRQPAKEVVT